jgi:drug/metabolite transporter (DMT)-like permease
MTRVAGIGGIRAVMASGLFSTGAILVRWAQGLTPVEVTSLYLLPGGSLRGGRRASFGRVGEPLRREISGPVPIALIATGHFLTFIASLSFTTAAHCLTLTYTAPHFIAGLSRAFLRDRLPRRALIAIRVGHIGVAVLAGLEPQLPIGC